MDTAIRDSFRRDLERAQAAGGSGLASLLEPGTQAVAVYRLGSFALGLDPVLRLVADPLYWVLHTLVRILWGIDISRHARIGPGLRVFGPIRVGSNVKIGANAVVHDDVPDNAVVALSPGFTILSFRGNRR